MTIKEIDQWHLIGNKLTVDLGICRCQRKLKSFIDILAGIHKKSLTNDYNYTGEEYFILAFLDSKDLITHGTNCEYPIVLDTEFWRWVLEVKDSPYLEDN